MATTSLGRLTLDLAVRLSDFSDGLSRAERETRDRTANMGASVRTFRDQMMEDLGGTQLGGVIDGLNERLASISGGGMMAGAAVAGMAAGGIAVAAGALFNMALETANADQQLERLAQRGKTSTDNLQILTAATASFGLEMDGIGDILADAQEKLGEFSANGGGGLVDTLELMQKTTKMTEAELEIFGKSLSTMDSVDAIQAVVNEMEKAGATTQEVRFVTESLASGLGDIIPLWDNNGEALRNYERDLNEAGVIRTQESIEQSKILAGEIDALKIQFEGVSNQLVTAALPAMATLIEYFKEGTKQGGSFKTEISGVGQAINITAASVVGVAAGMGLLINAFSTVGRQMANIGQTTTNFFAADTLADKGKALFTGFFAAGALASGSMLDISSQWARDMATIDKLLDGATRKMNKANTLRPVVNTSFSKILDPKGTNVAFPYKNDGIPYRTGEVDAEIVATMAMAKAAEENAKAEEKLAKALDKRSTALAKAQKVAGEVKLTPNKLALKNAENYGFANYEAQYGLPYGLMTGIHMQESHGKTNATGPMTKYGKAKGGFQLIDATAERFKVDNAYNMEQATEGAAKYLSYLYKRFDGDLTKTIAAYNTGEGNVDKNPMSLILSDRWARNKKTGIGQTKEYTKNVLAYMKSATTDTSKLVYDTVTKQAQDSQKLQEDTLRRQGSIIDFYATEKEKIVGEHTKRVTDIEAAYADGSADRIKYLAREQERYEKARNANALSIFDKYMNEEERIHEDHRKAMEFIDKTFIEGDPNRQLYVDRQNATYQKDLDNFRFANDAKKREQEKLYQSISDSAHASSKQATANGIDSMAQRTMTPQDYQSWRLDQDYRDTYSSINNQYTNRQSEINAKDERGNDLLPEIERNTLLEIARQEHLDNLWAMEQDYALKQQTLDDQLQDAKLQNYGTTLGAMGSLLGAFAGENNRISQLMFAAQKGYALAQIFMNNKVALSEAWASAPFPYNVPAVAMAALETGALAAAAQAITPSFSGIAHGGLDYVPKEQTYLLDKGERVLSPNQNKDFTNFMQGNKNGNGYSGDGVGEVNIVVTVDAKGNGSMTGDTADAFARTMAQQVEQTARNVVRKELMQGGMIDNRLRR